MMYVCTCLQRGGAPCILAGTAGISIIQCAITDPFVAAAFREDLQQCFQGTTKCSLPDTKEVVPLLQPEAVNPNHYYITSLFTT